MRTNRLWSVLVATAMFGAAAPAAYGGYTVIDDDLYPSGTAPTRFQALSASASKMDDSLHSPTGWGESHYTIPFVKNRSPLTATAKQELDELIPILQGAQIRIVGRIDAIAYTGGKLAHLGYNRAKVIRSYLMHKGIPADNIKIEVDDSPNPQSNGVTYPSDIYISHRNNGAAITSDSASYVSPSQYAKSPSKISTTGINPAENEQVIQFINQAVQSGQMSSQVAVKLIRYLMESATASVPVSHSTSYPSPASTNTAKYLRPEQPTVPTWALDEKLTLRENIDTWSKLAGWNPSQWDASNFYQVTVSTTIDGNFPDVLRQVADATGLNICAKKREKIVRVTDSNVSCK